MIYEFIYPSGHRQIVKPIESDAPGTPFYRCHTLSPAGDSLEFKILSEAQLQRTLKRVLNMGGSVLQKTTSADE